MPSLSKIEHFVVLMLENRSFDHMFGFRKGVNGLKGTEANRRNPAAPVSASNPAFKVGTAAPFEIPTKHAQGPMHNVPNVTLQLFGRNTAGSQPNNSGFVADYHNTFLMDVHREPSSEELGLVMQSFKPGSLPAMDALADEFVVCDQWFCEVPGPTHPNRLYVHAGTSAGFAHNVFDRRFDLLTIYELLAENGQNWATYQFDLNEVRNFDRLTNSLDCFRRFDKDFKKDVDQGRLPNYSFVVPRFTGTKTHASNSQHAPHDIRFGDLLIADTYDTLRANDAVWEKCALIVLYDEHGGFYDHVAPPSAVNPDGINSVRPDDVKEAHHSAPPPFAFDRLGPRVPCLIASPWVGKKIVESRQLQHTSILKTVRQRFGIAKSLSAREERATTFESVFDQSTARNTIKKLPRVTVPVASDPDHPSNPANLPLDTLNREMVRGVAAITRPSHPEDEDSIWLPKTHGEASEFVRDRWDRHARFLHER
jgi:phospholipase C